MITAGMDALLREQEGMDVISRETIRAMQLAKLNRLLLAEKEKQGFYRDLPEHLESLEELADLPFTTDEDLAAATLAGSDPVKGDRILCVGNPQNDWFARSYGVVTSGIERFGEAQGFPSNAMKHSAYIHEGSSGGAAFNEKMKLAGTVPGGSFSPDGKDFKYGMLIPASELKICIEEWKAQK